MIDTFDSLVRNFCSTKDTEMQMKNKPEISSFVFLTYTTKAKGSKEKQEKPVKWSVKPEKPMKRKNA